MTTYAKGPRPVRTGPRPTQPGAFSYAAFTPQAMPAALQQQIQNLQNYLQIFINAQAVGAGNTPAVQAQMDAIRKQIQSLQGSWDEGKAEYNTGYTNAQNAWQKQQRDWQTQAQAWEAEAPQWELAGQQWDFNSNPLNFGVDTNLYGNLGSGVDLGQDRFDPTYLRQYGQNTLGYRPEGSQGMTDIMKNMGKRFYEFGELPLQSSTSRDYFGNIMRDFMESRMKGASAASGANATGTAIDRSMDWMTPEMKRFTTERLGINYDDNFDKLYNALGKHYGGGLGFS